MGITGNEVSAANQQRRNEEISKAPVESVLESGTSAASAVVALGTSLAAGGHTGLVVAGSVVAGMGIVDWFRKLGTTKINENLEALGQATEDALNRVEGVLKEQGQTIDEIKRRLDSDELRNAMASASLQALRTTQQERIKRLALILANGVNDNDPASENVDDMMRAAVELKERDIFALRFIYSRQLKILEAGEKSPEHWYHNVRKDWQESGFDEGIVTQQAKSDHVDLKSSLSRLAAFGCIIAIPWVETQNSPGREPFALLREGAKFYERLQEIGSNAKPK